MLCYQLQSISHLNHGSSLQNKNRSRDVPDVPSHHP
jgi:hypothetical protein